MNNANYSVSVLVCSKNRPEHLLRCLKSIIDAYMIYPYKEIIVIDNGSDEEVQKIYRQAVLDIRGIYIYEPKRGLSAARNAGLKAVQGDIVVFADDDFIVDNNWVKNLLKNFEDTSVGCCTGKMAQYRFDEASNLFEKILSFDKGDKRHIFTKADASILSLLNKIISTFRAVLGGQQPAGNAPVPWSIGNGYFSLRRSIIEQIGYYDEKLGIGTPALGGEEIDMFYRILKAGYTVIYEPSAIIYHNHRPNKEQVLIASYNAGASTITLPRKYFLKDAYLSTCLFGVISFAVLTLIKSLIKQQDDRRIILKCRVQHCKGMMHNLFKWGKLR